MKKIIFLFLFTFAFANEERIFTLAELISGSKVECVGHEYFLNLEKYKKELDEAYNDADLYKKSIENYDKYYDYFIYWSYQSIGNKRLFDEFNKESKKFCEDFKEHFVKTSGKNYKKACENYIQRLGMRAFGAINKFVKLDGIYSEFLELSDEDAIAFLNGISPNYYELDFLLKLALLDKKDLKVIDFLINYGASINSGYESALFYALDYYDALVYLLDNGANVNYKNSFGKTPIFYAIETQDLKTIKLLISRGANLNQQLIDNEEQIKINLPYYISICEYIHPSITLFIHAANYDNVEILKLLVENGADYNESDNFGLNALDYAKIANNKKAIKYLTELGLKENNIE